MKSRARNTPHTLRPHKTKEWEDPWNRLVIDLDAIRSNYHHLRSHLPEECVFYAVLKSDAYGHGIIEVSNALIDAGCQHFAVGDLLEAIAPSKLIKIAKGTIPKPHLRLEGLYAQSRDPASAREGFEKIKAIYERMQSEGIAPRRLHFANSTTFLSHPDTVAGGSAFGNTDLWCAPTRAIFRRLTHSGKASNEITQ